MIESSDDEPCVSILVMGQEADNQNEFFTCYKKAVYQLCLGSASELVAIPATCVVSKWQYEMI